MALSQEQFSAALSSSGLFSPEAASDLVREYASRDGAGDSRPFAEALVSAGHLTAYQASALCSGRIRWLVFGNYAVIDRIGTGGMGEVYKAVHRQVGRTVAIKVVRDPATHGNDSDAVLRFHREVKAASRLDHPHVVQALDTGEKEGLPFLVMEYVAGRDLSEVVRRCGPLAPAAALDYVLQAARGLEYAHAQGVVHRDIKPANLLLSVEGAVKILDLGLSRLQFSAEDESTEAALTQSGSVMGSVDFMAPEQAESSRRADRRSDIYGLGCTLYYLLTGATMYPAETVVQKILAHRQRPVPLLQQKRPDVPAEVNGVFQKMVAKLPEMRYPSMTELIAELEICCTLLGPPPPPCLDEETGETLVGAASPNGSRSRAGSSVSRRQTLPTENGARSATLVAEPRVRPTPPDIDDFEYPPAPGGRWGRRVFRLTLLPILALVGLFGAWGGNLMRTARSQAAAVEMIRAAGGVVWYDYEAGDLPFPLPSRPESPLRAMVGDDLTHNVIGVSLTGPGVKSELLEELRRLPHLRSLDLSHTSLGDRDVNCLAACPALERLIAAGAPLSDDGMPALGQLRRLRWLDLSDTGVSDRGLFHLDGLTQLERLALTGTRVSDAGVARLRESLRKVDVRH